MPLEEDLEDLVALLRRNPNARARVAIDIDETIATTFEVGLRIHNSIRGTNYKLSDNKSFDLSCIGSSPVEWESVYVQSWLERHSEIRFIGDSAKLNELRSYYEVSLVTSGTHTHDDSRGSTIDALTNWLKIHGLGSFPLVLCQPGTSKADLDYHIYIDDSPGLAAQIAGREDKALLLIKSHWNVDFQSRVRGVVPVDDVNHASKLLIDAARKSAGRGNLRIAA